MFFSSVLFSFILGAYTISILVNPLLPGLNLQLIHGLPKVEDVHPQAPSLVVTRQAQMVMGVEKALKHETRKFIAIQGQKYAEMKGRTKSSPPFHTILQKTALPFKPLAIGFYVNWDDSSYQSLKHNLNQLDWVIPEWMRIEDGDNRLVLEVDQKVVNLIRREHPKTLIIPIINNAKAGIWHPGTLARAIADKTKRQKLINAIVKNVAQNRFNGVCIDFEEVPQNYQKNLLHFMQELHAAFKPRGWFLIQAVPFDDNAWNYRAYQDATDYLLLMAYDQHWNKSIDGSISGQGWYERILGKRFQELDPFKTIICIGGYGYDWGLKHEANAITFQEAVLEAWDFRAKISLDPDSLNPRFVYEDEDGAKHTVWFLDAVTAYNQIHIARLYNCAGFALWRLGSEDPSLWSVFGSTKTGSSPEDLWTIRGSYEIDFEGEGEILQIEVQLQDGTRDIAIDKKSGLIIKDDYTSIPSSYVIRRRSGPTGTIALTFDDGPDPSRTIKILDILKQE